MAWMACDGRECKPGWGYNRDLDLLVPVEETPLNIVSENINQISYYVSRLSSTSFLYRN